MNKNLKPVALALSFSIVALAISVYAGFNAYQLKANLLGAENDDAFNAKVEQGINAFIKKQQDEMEAAQAAQAAEANTPVDVSLDNDAVEGDADAPVTIVEFSDFQCPYCGRYVKDTYPQIKEKYIDTGKVKYVFRDFPLGFHQNARPAAIAAECVREQGGDSAFWEYHDTLFANQEALSADDLKGYASDMGYNIDSCLDSEKYGDEVDADMAEGASYGVSGTPAFFINGKKLVGAQPFAQFEAAIEAELNQ